MLCHSKSTSPVLMSISWTMLSTTSPLRERPIECRLRRIGW